MQQSNIILAILIILTIVLMTSYEQSSKEHMYAMLAGGLTAFMLGRNYGKYGSLWE